MVNKQLDGLIDFLMTKQNVEENPSPEPFKWNQAKTDDFNHNNMLIALGNEYPKATIIDSKQVDSSSLPPSSERVYFSTAEPPKDYKGKIYTGEKGSKFWLPTAKELKSAKPDAIFTKLTPYQKELVHQYKDAQHDLPPGDVTEADYEEISALTQNLYDSVEDPLKPTKKGKAFKEKLQLYLDKISDKIAASKTHDETATAPSVSDKKDKSDKPEKGSLADKLLATEKPDYYQGLEDFKENFHNYDLSNIGDFIRSDEFRDNPNYNQLKQLFTDSVLSGLRGGEFYNKVSDMHDTYADIVKGPAPTPLKEQSWELMNDGFWGWGASATKSKDANYLAYWVGELTDAPMTFGHPKYGYKLGYNPDFNGIYKNEADRDATIQKLVAAIDGGEEGVTALGSIGHYPPFKDVKEAKDMLKRVRAGKKWNDKFWAASESKTNKHLQEMAKNGYEPLEGKSSAYINGLSRDEKKQHMRALYRQTFDNVRMISTAMYAHTHPNHKTVSFWRGTHGQHSYAELAGSSINAPTSLSKFNKKVAEETLGIDLSDPEGSDISMSVNSIAGGSIHPNEAISWAEQGGPENALLIQTQVEPKDVFPPYPLGVGKNHISEHESGILKGSAGGRPGKVWHGAHKNLSAIKAKGHVGNWNPKTTEYDKDDWYHKDHPNKLKSLNKNLGGSNPGSIMEDKDGKQYYVKYGNQDQSVVENLSNQLYEAAGVPVNKSQLITYQGNTAHLTPYQKTAKDMSATDMAAHKDVQEGFIVDAWLGNCDVVGSGNTNIKTVGKKAIRVDNGGSLYMRAQAGKKNDSEFWDATDVVTELESMRGQGELGHLGKHTSPVFKNISDAQLKTGYKKLHSFNLTKIDDIVNKSGLPDNFKEKMKYTLIKRRKAILDAYPDWKKEIIKG